MFPRFSINYTWTNGPLKPTPSLFDTLRNETIKVAAPRIARAATQGMLRALRLESEVDRRAFRRALDILEQHWIDTEYSADSSTSGGGLMNQLGDSASSGSEDGAFGGLGYITSSSSSGNGAAIGTVRSDNDSTSESCEAASSSSSEQGDEDQARTRWLTVIKNTP